MRFYLYLFYSLKCPLVCFSINSSRISSVSTFTSSLSQHSNVLFRILICLPESQLLSLSHYPLLFPAPSFYFISVPPGKTYVYNQPLFYSASQSLFTFPPIEFFLGGNGDYLSPIIIPMGVMPLVSNQIDRHGKRSI